MRECQPVRELHGPCALHAGRRGWSRGWRGARLRATGTPRPTWSSCRAAAMSWAAATALRPRVRRSRPGLRARPMTLPSGLSCVLLTMLWAGARHVTRRRGIPVGMQPLACVRCTHSLATALVTPVLSGARVWTQGRAKGGQAHTAAAGQARRPGDARHGRAGGGGGQDGHVQEAGCAGSNCNTQEAAVRLACGQRSCGLLFVSCGARMFEWGEYLCVRNPFFCRVVEGMA